MVDAYCRRGRSADVHLSIIGVRVADEAGTRDDGEQYLRYVDHIFIGSHGKCQGHEHMQFENGIECVHQCCTTYQLLLMLALTHVNLRRQIWQEN